MAQIEKRGNSYRITVYTGRDIYGKKLRETTTFTPDPSLTPKKKEKAIQDFARNYEQQVLNGMVLDGRKTTLKEFSERWMEEYGKQHLQPRTIESYNGELARILPKLGHYKLSELKPATLNSFFSAMTKDGARLDGKPGGYAKATIARTKAVLASILSTASDWELIEKNPLEKVHYEAEPASETIKFFTTEQANIFLQYIEQPYTVTTKGHKRIDDTGIEYTVGDYTTKKEMQEQLRILFNLALFGGLRKGELLALEWSDIDFKNDIVSISKAATVVGNQQSVKCPKTKNSHRKVSIPHFLTQRIQKLKTDRIRYRLSLGDYWQGGDWLFIQENGKQMNYSTPTAAFHDTLLRYNKDHAEQLPVIPLHGLRHTSATLLIANNLDVRSVSSRLGHAQTSTTLNIYSHALQEADKKAASTLENLLVKQA